MELVSIWLACRDHHGRLITEAGINAQVAAHDPSNAIVQYWNVALSSTGSGIKNLQLRLSDAPPLGVWTVRASAGDQTASQTFELVDAINDSVASAASAVDASHPSPTVSTVLIVEPHFVELNFSPRTASSIRQGSPFVGEVKKRSSILVVIKRKMCFILVIVSSEVGGRNFRKGADGRCGRAGPLGDIPSSPDGPLE